MPIPTPQATLLLLALLAPAARTQVAHYGRIVDVYGQRTRNGSTVVELFRAGTLVNPRAQRSGPVSLSANPDSLRTRILIEAEVGSAAFRDVLARLTADLPVLPRSGATVPRDAAIRITSAPRTQVPARLVDLATGAALPARTLSRGDSVILDPSLTGTEALKRRVTPRPGLPEGTDAGIRLDRHGAPAWTFRSAGVLPDPVPPRILGEMTMYLLRVQEVDPDTRLLTLFRDGVRHRIDRGDVLRISRAPDQPPLAAVEVLRDAPDPLTGGKLARVLVRTARDADGRDLLAALAPARPRRIDDASVRQHAPRAVLLATFDPGDAGRDFVQLADKAGRAIAPGSVVPPLVSCTVRFTKPLDLASVGALSTLYFAQHRQGKASNLIPSRIDDVGGAGTTFVLSPPLGFPHVSTPARDARDLVWTFHVVGGKSGVKGRDGTALPASLRGEFALDPAAPANQVGYRVVRPDVR